MLVWLKVEPSFTIEVLLAAAAKRHVGAAKGCPSSAVE
jgi:hypothetical protein